MAEDKNICNKKMNLLLKILLNFAKYINNKYILTQKIYYACYIF
jgi:hypothetical protein